MLLRKEITIVDHCKNKHFHITLSKQKSTNIMGQKHNHKKINEQLMEPTMGNKHNYSCFELQ
jgi:hypothetical protein